MALSRWLSAAEPAGAKPEAPTPFRNLREARLSYEGPVTDATNLTELRIGWFGPSDPTNRLGADLWWAANLAIREANELGNRRSNAPLPTPDPSLSTLSPPPASPPFRLIPRWAVDPWGTGVSQLTRMVYDEQPLALIGSVDSASTHLAEQVVAKANLPLVSPIATDTSVTLAGVPWMFTCAPSDDAIARTLVDDLLSALEAAGAGAPLAVLATTDHESRMTAREVLKELARRGRQPDFRFDVGPGAQAIARHMAALDQSKPAAVLVVAGPEDGARLVRAVRENGAAAVDTPVIFGSHALGRTAFRELAGRAAEGVRVPLLWSRDPADPVAQRFVEEFVAARRRLPDYTAVLAYDTTRLLIEAIRRAGPNRARIRETLKELSPWAGMAGPIRFDGTGRNVRSDLSMGVFRDGLLVPLEHRPLAAARPASP